MLNERFYKIREKNISPENYYEYIRVSGTSEISHLPFGINDERYEFVEVDSNEYHENLIREIIIPFSE